MYSYSQEEASIIVFPVCGFNDDERHVHQDYYVHLMGGEGGRERERERERGGRGRREGERERERERHLQPSHMCIQLCMSVYSAYIYLPPVQQ